MNQKHNKPRRHNACHPSGFDVFRQLQPKPIIAFAALLRHLHGEQTPLQEDIHPNLPLAVAG
jgi:hypothetical protein